jgi:hypothetical protein
MAAALSVDVEGWRRKSDELMLRVGARFARVEPRRRMAAFARGLLAGYPGELLVHRRVRRGAVPPGMQRLIRRRISDGELAFYRAHARTRCHWPCSPWLLVRPGQPGRRRPPW